MPTYTLNNAAPEQDYQLVNWSFGAKDNQPRQGYQLVNWSFGAKDNQPRQAAVGDRYAGRTSATPASAA